MRLIDADALKEALADVKAHYDCFDEDEKKFYEAYSKAVEILDIYLEDAPTVDAVEERLADAYAHGWSDAEAKYHDAVEVVRCKDCVFHRLGFCRFWQEDITESDFCSYGEEAEKC